MERKWQTFARVGLSIALILSLIGNFLLMGTGPEYGHPPWSKNLVVGTLAGPPELDPLDSFESYSEDVIIQVCEGLYQHNLSDPHLGFIPILAADYGSWNPSATKLTIPLRQGILFHDGTKFNASSVQWIFERVNYFINSSGMPMILNETISKIHYLYEFPNGTTIFDPINPVTINSEYNVTINLRGSYAILESLLCHVSAYILSPASTPKYEYIHPVYGRIIGTGPFAYDFYVVYKEIKLHRWDKYWREPAFFEGVTFAVINDAVTRNNAMLGHTIDYLIGSMSSLFPTFDADPTITHQAGIQGLSYYSLGMNNEYINKTWRQAISYGINYTQILENYPWGTVYRSNGPLAPNSPMYDPSIQAAIYNLTRAREIVVSMGFGAMNWTDTQWQAATFATWNFSYIIGNDFCEELLFLLQDNLGLIGIEIIDQGQIWVLYPMGYFNPFLHTTIHLWWGSWYPYRGSNPNMVSNPDYLSPYNFIFKHFSNGSFINEFHYHSHDVEMWLEQVLKEPNADTRQALYSNILHQIVEVDMPHAFGYHPYQHSVHSGDIRGVPYNSMSKIYVYPMYRV